MQNLNLDGANTLPWKNAQPPSAIKESVGEGQAKFLVIHGAEQRQLIDCLKDKLYNKTCYINMNADDLIYDII